jgi:N6-adenosine-specific RNA methylase IME4
MFLSCFGCGVDEMTAQMTTDDDPLARALARQRTASRKTTGTQDVVLGDASEYGILIHTRRDPTSSEYKTSHKGPIGSETMTPSAADLLGFVGTRRFRTILADPPWRFANRTGKMAPEHKRLSRYGTMTTDEVAAIPIPQIVDKTAHLYLWVPNALLPEGLSVMKAWGFEYKTNVVWHKLRKDGGSDGRGVGFYFRNVTELLLFGIRGKNARTLAPGRRQVNYMGTRKREHSRKPDEQYQIIEACSPGPFLELFARGTRANWATWGNQADDEYRPTWKTYAHHSRAEKELQLFD